MVKHKSCCLCDCDRFIVSIGSPCLERFGKSEKFFKKNLRLSCLSHPKTKKAEGLPLLDVGLEVWLCLSKTPSIIPQNSPFELNLMFCTQSRFTYYSVLYWVRVRYEHSRYILLKEGHPCRPLTFFIKVSTWIQRFVLAWFGLLGFITKSVCTKSVCTIYVANMFNIILGLK